MALELAEVRLDRALVFVHARSGEVVFHRAVGVAPDFQVNSTGVPLGRHPPFDVGMIAVGSMVLSSRAFRNSRRSAATASGLGGILPSGRSVSCQGSWLSVFVVDSSHRITNGSCIGGSLVVLCGKSWFCLSLAEPLEGLPG